MSVTFTVRQKEHILRYLFGVYIKTNLNIYQPTFSGDNLQLKVLKIFEQLTVNSMKPVGIALWKKNEGWVFSWSHSLFPSLCHTTFHFVRTTKQFPCFPIHDSLFRFSMFYEEEVTLILKWVLKWWEVCGYVLQTTQFTVFVSSSFMVQQPEQVATLTVLANPWKRK